MLTKQEILEADDRHDEIVIVPEWGGDVCVTEMSALQRDAWEMACYEQGKLDGPPNVRALLCVYCVVDADGKRIFDPADAMALGRKSGRAVDRVFAVAQRMNGLGAAAIEEMEKNSMDAPSDETG